MNTTKDNGTLRNNEKPNLIGQRFGRLLVIGAAPSDKNGRSMWLTRCDCGTESVKKGKYLLNGDTVSCGCRQREVSSENGRKNLKRNQYYIDNDQIIHVRFTNTDNEFICDYNDIEYVKHYTWFESEQGYARCILENNKRTFFHNLIMENSIDKKEYCDHINGDRLNNTRKNLRIVNCQQNCMNRKTFSNSKTGTKGVYLQPNGKWIATIRFCNRTRHLGTFLTKEDAIRVRRKAEKELFGEYRRIDDIKISC